MKIEIEEIIEVTMKMTLAEARLVQRSLGVTSLRESSPEINDLYVEVRHALAGRKGD